jgi:hypothetical protein
LNDRFKERSAVRIEDETQTLAAEARCIPEQTNNDEGTAADLQIKQRKASAEMSWATAAKAWRRGIPVDVHDNGLAFGDTFGKGLQVK